MWDFPDIQMDIWTDIPTWVKLNAHKDYGGIKMLWVVLINFFVLG